jgi:hypothetical protein
MQLVYRTDAPRMTFHQQLPAALVEGWAKRLAVHRHELGEHESVEALGDRAHTYRGVARLLLDPEGPAREAELRLRMSIAQKVYGCDFDKLALEDKYEIAEEAHLAIVSVLETYAGPKVPLTTWRRDSLLLDGDPEYVQRMEAV